MPGGKNRKESIFVHDGLKAYNMLIKVLPLTDDWQNRDCVRHGLQNEERSEFYNVIQKRIGYRVSIPPLLVYLSFRFFLPKYALCKVTAFIFTELTTFSKKFKKVDIFFTKQ